MSKRLATIYVILAGVLWGVISIFINTLNSYGFSSVQISFLRVFSCSILMLIFLLIYDRTLLKINIRDIWMFVGTGIISLTLFSYCYFTTIINVEASIAVSLLYTSPIFVMLFSALLFKERVNATKIVAIIATVVGCALVSGMVGSSAKMSAKAFVIGICAGLFYALYSIFGRYATEKYHPLTITFYTFVFASIGFWFIASPITTISTLIKSPKSILVVIISGIICGILPYIFYTIGLKSLDTSVAGVLVAVEPLVGSVVGIIVYNESKNALKLIGIILILASIVLLNIKWKNLPIDK